MNDCAYELVVNDDGDSVVTKRPADAPGDGTTLIFHCGNELKEELYSYGWEDDDIDDAMEQLSSADIWESVTV